MASSEVQTTNGHHDDVVHSLSRDVEHEDPTGSSAVEPVDRPEPETGLEVADTAQHEQLGSAQPGEMPVSVLDNAPAGQSSKPKLTASPAKRPTPTVQTTGTKGASGPPTPQVRKILNSGKFGTGLTKAVPPPTSKPTDTPSIPGKPSTTPQASSTVKSNLPAKKSPVSASAPSSKATMPPKSSNAPWPVPAPTRRSSLAPAKPAVPPSRSSTLSASTSGKLPSTTTSSAASKPVASQRSSLVSPDSAASVKSAANPRPRASLSEAVIPKKAAPPRAGLVPSKQSSTSTARPARTPGAGSISSLREVKESGPDLVELQSKLDEATASLDLKTTAISGLETQAEELKASLESITADLDATRQSLEDAENARSTAEKELEETRTASATAQGGAEKLEQVLGELDAARTAAAEQNAVVETLQEQIKALQAELDESRQALEALRAEHANYSDIVAAAETDRQTLVKARADFEAIRTETVALKAVQAEALDTAAANISTLEAEAAHAKVLAAEIASLRAEKEETSNKFSELEVEILELKEAQDLAEGELKTRQVQINTLREELASVTLATEKAVQEAESKERAAAEHLEEVKKQHEAALTLVQEESVKLTEQIHASQAEIAEIRSDIVAVNAAAASAAEEHTHRLTEAKSEHQARQYELNAEIERISTELAAQEAVYNAKVQTVKDEHNELLQEAFERAKNEAGDVHGQDLQALREKSEVATEQLRSSHEATVEGLKSDHESALASQEQGLQKQLSSQALELKATAEDLAKAKATLSTSLQEIETLKAQVDGARETALTAVSATAADKDAEIARLTKELENARDDFNGLNEALRITQDSMREMGNHHQMELKEAAEGRAEEVSKLRAVHDAEIQTLVVDKSSLVTKLSDLEGELHTLRASAASTETAASPKRNGSVAAPAETVTKEELERMHEAHNLKMNDLQAQHDKEIRALKEQVEAALAKTSEAEQDLERRKMEITYLEQDQEESQDQITRLKEDVERLSELSSSTK